MNFVSGNTLEQLQKEKLSNEDCAYLVFSLINDLKWIIEKGYVHGDLNLNNAVYDKKSRKGSLVDLGFAAKLSSCSTMLGTLAYAAPERKEDQQTLITEKTEVYALGLILAEICGFGMMQGSNLQGKFIWFNEKMADNDLRKALFDLIKGMAADKEARYSAAQASEAAANILQVFNLQTEVSIQVIEPEDVTTSRRASSSP